MKFKISWKWKKFLALNFYTRTLSWNAQITWYIVNRNGLNSCCWYKYNWKLTCPEFFFFWKETETTELLYLKVLFLLLNQLMYQCQCHWISHGFPMTRTSLEGDKVDTLYLVMILDHVKNGLLYAIFSKSHDLTAKISPVFFS